MCCGCTAQFVSDLVGNPEDRFSCDAAHILRAHIYLIIDPSGNPRAFLTFDNCCENSSNFCCSGVLSVSVSIISFRILPEIQKKLHV